MRWMRNPTNPSSCITYINKFIVKSFQCTQNKIKIKNNYFNIFRISQNVSVYVCVCKWNRDRFSWLGELKENIMGIQDGHKMEWGPNLPHRLACLMNLEVQAGSSMHFASKDSLDDRNSSHGIIVWEHSCCIIYGKLVRMRTYLKEVKIQNVERIFVLYAEQFSA